MGAKSAPYPPWGWAFYIKPKMMTTLAHTPNPSRVTPTKHTAAPLCLSHHPPATMTNTSGQWPNHNFSRGIIAFN
jgi:hypothetical protein